MNEQLTKTVSAMFEVMDHIKAGTMKADDAHAMVRAGAVIVKAHEVDCVMRATDDRLGKNAANLRAIAAE